MKKIFILDTSSLLLMAERHLNVIDYIHNNFGSSPGQTEIILPDVVMRELKGLAKAKKSGSLALGIIQPLIGSDNVSLTEENPSFRTGDSWIEDYLKKNSRAIVSGEISVYVCTTDLKLRSTVKKLGARVILLIEKSRFGIE